MLQVTGGAHSGQGEVEAVLILIAHGAQRQPAVFHREPTAVPVLGRLDAPILQGILDKVVARIDAGAKPALGRISIPQQ
jgi:hypothetical protein